MCLVCIGGGGGEGIDVNCWFVSGGEWNCVCVVYGVGVVFGVFWWVGVCGGCVFNWFY